MATPGQEEIRAASYVGFDSITRQIEKKLVKRGFQFNVIVVGTCSMLSYIIISRVYSKDIRFLERVLTLRLGVAHRPDWTWKVDPHQHHLCVSLDRLKRSSRG